MATKTIYTLGQAARILGMPEVEVQMFIESGQLLAEFNQGLMGYMIAQDHLLDFMKSRKMFSQMQKIMMNRVLICDRDQHITFIVRTELERSGKISVRIATSSRDVERSITEFLPDVLTMPLAALQRATDNLAGVIRPARADRPMRLVLYSNEPEIILEGRDDVKHLRETLKIDEIVSIASGTRKLVTKIEEIFGIKRETRKLPTFPGFTSTKPPGTKQTKGDSTPPLPPVP